MFPDGVRNAMNTWLRAFAATAVTSAAAPPTRSKETRFTPTVCPSHRHASARHPRRQPGPEQPPADSVVLLDEEERTRTPDIDRPRRHPHRQTAHDDGGLGRL